MITYLSSRNLLLFLILPAFLLQFSGASAQQADKRLLQKHLDTYAQQHEFSPEDVAEWKITHSHTTSHNGVSHVYIQQEHQGIPVFNGVANFALKGGQVVHFAERLQKHLATRANATQPGIEASEAIAFACQHLGLPTPTVLAELRYNNRGEVVFSRGGVSSEEIPVRLVYQPGPEGELFLSYDLSILPRSGSDWWSVRVDALDGQLRSKHNWMVTCNVSSHPKGAHVHHSLPKTQTRTTRASRSALIGGGTYRVFPFYTESPNHGPRLLLNDPADSLASPFGWHDTTGTPGADYTITRGNNVYASEDRDADNVPGYSPDGGSSLIFDFPINFSLQPVANMDAAITNLFYHNNVIHDILYHYGFTEAAGNFQQNNYGRGGLGADYVNADALDGAGFNNANFGTPPDGSNPRMQMFLWSGGGSSESLVINSPTNLARSYTSSNASFGPPIPATPLTADLVLAKDGIGDSLDVCDPIVNASAISGKIAVILRGGCSFVAKVEAAQNAGAIAVIIVNNVGGGTITMGGASNNINIPSVMISQADGTPIIAALQAGTTVNGTLQDNSPPDIDGDYDNGIVAHEYGHGVSNRLTGGAGNTSCLFNAEQMGEGWSDYLTLIFALDTAFTDRGIGTYAIGQSITGGGIRPARYSRDLSINPYTYASTNQTGAISQPHGIGFVWCSMLWDMTLDLIDVYGYDPDIFNGTGGNNIALQLVMDGMSLQNCQPGFVDGRDAILLADQLNNGGANQCLIWEAFARRGLGFSANQGSNNDRQDQVEAFDLPTTCLTPTAPPVANFGFSNTSICGNRVTFSDLSSSVPQHWNWDFGDGNTDSSRNPVHVYTREGLYFVKLVVSNSLGIDSVQYTVAINFPAGPSVPSTEVCSGEQVLLTATGSSQVFWLSDMGDTLSTSSTYFTPTLFRDSLFYVSQITDGDTSKIGPANGAFASGGYHNTGFYGTLNFEAFSEFELVSAWVDAGSSGQRIIYLREGNGGGGNVVDSAIVVLSQGQQRVNLNLEVPGPGIYSVGGSSLDLFRNNAGAQYPYVLSGILSINSSSSTTDPQGFYYYLYDWEVREPGCPSRLEPVFVTVKSAAYSFTEDTTTRTFTFTDQSNNATSWSWSFGDGSTSTQQNPIHTYAIPGIYPVTLTINGSCTIVDTVVAQIIAGVDDKMEDLVVELQPNPASSYTLMQFSKALARDIVVEMTNLEGKLIRQETLRAGETQLRWNLADLARGIYFVRVNTEGGLKVMKLLVE